VLDIPHALKGHVVVKQEFSSFNPLDFKVHTVNAGHLPFPFTLGWDISGVVSEVGEDVKGFQVGDKVFGFTNLTGGSFAEYVAVNQEHIAKREHAPAADAAALPVVFATTWQPLFCNDDLNNRKGQTIFIPGGGGGIGHIAIQLAKWKQLKVITSGSKEDSLNLCKQLGADLVVDYSKSNVVEEVMKFTNNEGVDLVLDATYSSSSFAQSASVVKKGGRWFRIGNTWNQAANDEEARAICEKRGVDAQNGDLRRYWVPPYMERMHEMTHSLVMSDKLYASGHLKVHISQVVPYTLEAVRKGVLESGTGKHFAKVVIDFSKKE